MMAGVPFDPALFTPDPELRVMSAAVALGDPDTEEGRKIIADAKSEEQHGFRFKNTDGIEIGCVIAPFRDEFCVWGVIPGGRAIRF